MSRWCSAVAGKCDGQVVGSPKYTTHLDRTGDAASRDGLQSNSLGRTASRLGADQRRRIEVASALRRARSAPGALTDVFSGKSDSHPSRIVP